jgi:hypothetical protein
MICHTFRFCPKGRRKVAEMKVSIIAALAAIISQKSLYAKGREGEY